MALSDSKSTLQDVTGLWQVAGLEAFDSRLSQDVTVFGQTEGVTGPSMKLCQAL